MKFSFSLALVGCLSFCSFISAATPKYMLKAELAPGDAAHVTVKLEVGGELIMPTEKDATDEKVEKKLPTRVLGNLDYQEQLVAWSADPNAVARSIRDYKTATAKFDVEDQTTDRTLADDERLMLAEVRDGLSNLTGANDKLTREQLDLVNIVANTLAIDRLLPGKELAEGDTWTHDAATLGALLCMDHVGVCDVSSVVTAESERQVQIRLAGTVHGTIDGTPTEMELRAAYLFHLDKKRITRFNFAIKETRKSSDIVPGLDVVAKAFVEIEPNQKRLTVPPAVKKLAERTSEPLTRTLVYESPKNDFRFEYDAAWFITAEERDLYSFRYLHDHELTAHCNLSVLAPRSAGRHTPLDEFERDVRQSLGDKLGSVSAATEWQTKRGYNCLGVIAEGKVNDVPIQWRNYLVSTDNAPRLSLAVTLEKDRSDKFADAERQIIDSIELVPMTTATTASKKEGVSR